MKYSHLLRIKGNIRLLKEKKGAKIKIK